MLASVVLALGACSGSSSEDVHRTSGPLADGFVIEPRSALIATVFPAADGEGMRAVIAVDADMERVFEGYVQQAEDLGYPMESGTAWGDPRIPQGQWCSDDSDAWGPFEVRCSGYTSGLDDRSASLHGVGEPDGRGFIHLVTAHYSEVRASPTLAPEGPMAALTDVEVAPDLSASEPIRVVEGSELLFDPLPLDCYSGSYVAMLRVEGDPAPVMRAYRKQFTGVGATSVGVVGDGEKLSVSGGIAGGGDLGAFAVKGEPSYILIERCVLN